MARIKHIAIRTPDPEKTAAFYKDVFGLKEVGRARAGCYLSDGYINLAILKSKDEGTGEGPRDEADYAGVHHFGFMVDDVDETCRKLEAAGIPYVRRSALDARAGSLPHVLLLDTIGELSGLFTNGDVVFMMNSWGASFGMAIIGGGK